MQIMRDILIMEIMSGDVGSPGKQVISYIGDKVFSYLALYRVLLIIIKFLLGVFLKI
jgi:hypothetical protein